MNSGTVFKLNPDGTGYTVLKEFTGSDGAYPLADVTWFADALYGTTSEGGGLGFGTVFRLELAAPVALKVEAHGNAIRLRWNNPAFALQAAPAVNGPYTNVSAATSPFTNAIAGPHGFFRLVTH